MLIHQTILAYFDKNQLSLQKKLKHLKVLICITQEYFGISFLLDADKLCNITGADLPLNTTLYNNL